MSKVAMSTDSLAAVGTQVLNDRIIALEELNSKARTRISQLLGLVKDCQSLVEKGVSDRSEGHLRVALKLLDVCLTEKDIAEPLTVPEVSGPIFSQTSLDHPSVTGDEPSSRRTSLLPVETIGKLCQSCQPAVGNTIRHFQDRIDQLERTNRTLASEALQSKALETEIEDLTANLFDQANRMVVQESRLRHDLWLKTQSLSAKIAELNNILVPLKEENGFLKSRICYHKNCRRKRGSRSAIASPSSNNELENSRNSSGKEGLSAAKSDDEILKGHLEKGSSGSLGVSNSFSSEFSVDGADDAKMKSNFPMYVDGIALSEFQDHLKLISRLKLDPRVDALQSPFVKKVMIEDVDPLLALFRQMKVGMKRKLSDAFTKGFLVFKEAPQSAESPISKQKCACCGLSRACDFTVKVIEKKNFSLSSMPDQRDLPGEILAVDRFCKDRLMVVNDFYFFLGQLHTGHLQLPLLNLFKLFVQHRYKLFLAKIGAISVVEECNLDHVRIVH